MEFQSNRQSRHSLPPSVLSLALVFRFIRIAFKKSIDNKEKTERTNEQIIILLYYLLNGIAFVALHDVCLMYGLNGLEGCYCRTH